MLRHLSKVLSICLASTVLAGAAAQSPARLRSLPYDEAARPAEDLTAALAVARERGRRVLIVFGANWCPDCRKLDADLGSGRLAELVAQAFIVVKVDVGRFDRNLDFVKLYGKPIAKGIPSIAVVTAHNEIVHVAQGGELADARSMSTAQVEAYFDDLAWRTAR